MNWEAIGAIGEMIAAAAVVVTLVFLSIQLRANSAALRAQTKQSLADNVQDRFLATATSPELSAIIGKVRNGATWDELDDIESEQFRHWAAAVFNQVANYYSQYQFGTISKLDWETRRDLLLIQLQSPAIRTFWDMAAVSHGKDFYDEINRQLSADA